MYIFIIVLVVVAGFAAGSFISVAPSTLSVYADVSSVVSALLTIAALGLALDTVTSWKRSIQGEHLTQLSFEWGAVFRSFMMLRIYINEIENGTSLSASLLHNLVIKCRSGLEDAMFGLSRVHASWLPQYESIREKWLDNVKLLNRIEVAIFNYNDGLLDKCSFIAEIESCIPALNILLCEIENLDQNILSSTREHIL